MTKRALVGIIVASAAAVVALAESVPREYLVVRPVVESAEGRRTECTRHVDMDICYDPEEVLLDLRHVLADSARVFKDDWPEPGATFSVGLTLSAEGKRIVETWSSKNVGRRLGTFIQGKLKEAPILTGPLSGDLLIIATYTERSEAESLRVAIRTGGS